MNSAAAAAVDRADHADRAARAALSAAVEPADEAVSRRVERDGAEATWQAVREGDGALDPTELLRNRAQHVDGEEVLARAERLGIGFLCPGDPGWPEALDSMAASLATGAEPVPPPFGLWLRGEADLGGAVASAVAVVGSRNATRYGERVSSDLGADLAIAGWTVVSGAAFGIDAAAHRGALSLGGTTVAVLASGVDTPYPRSHASLLARIAGQGVVISEVPPGTRPVRSRFLSRNRVIAGLCAGTVVVEAALRSGALSTASWAAKLSREVLAVPGPVTSALSAGCHNLVRERGAVMVTDAREVLDAVGRLGADAAPVQRGEDRPFDQLPAAQRMVREWMAADGPSSVSGLAATTGLPPDAVRSALRDLAASGWVTQRWDGWYLGSRPGHPEWRT